MKLPNFTQEEESLLYNSVIKKIFTEEKGKIFIGGEEIQPELLDILKEQARYLKTSQLYEVFSSTMKAEAANLSLIQSQNWDNVQFAKALFHLSIAFDKMITTLEKK